MEERKPEREAPLSAASPPIAAAAAASLWVGGIFAPSIVSVLQLRPLTSALSAACSVFFDPGIQAVPTVSFKLIKKNTESQ